MKSILALRSTGEEIGHDFALCYVCSAQYSVSAASRGKVAMTTITNKHLLL